jgi:long-chain fatty acid transport protein
VEVVDFAPGLAYRVNDNLSVAAGLDVYWAKSAQLDSNLTRLRGDGYGLGFNLSALYKRDAFSAGLSFRSASTVSVDGRYTPLNQFLVTAGRLAPAQSASVDFDLPWRLALGVRYEVNDQLAVELDYNRTGWSNFETLEVDGDDTGPIFSDVNDWDDANAYRLGVTYRLRPETQLRFGYAYDETGQPDGHFSARVPDNDRQLFSIGLAQSLGNGYSIEGAYCYVVADDRDFRSYTAYTGEDVNGTSALDGKYSLDAHTLAIQLVKTF